MLSKAEGSRIEADVLAKRKARLTGGGESGIIKATGMYRRTDNTKAFAHLPERMSKKYIRKIAKKYGPKYVQDNMKIFEIEAKEEEEKFVKKLKEEGLL